MTDKPTPTDAELEALLLDKLPASKHYIRPVIGKMVAAMQAAIDKWGQPVVAGDVDRADAVNLARNALTQYDCAITKKGVRVLAEAVLSMDSALTTPQPTQAQAAEPVARLVIGKTKGGVSLTHMVVPAAYQLQEGVYALYTASQPVAREPLAPEQIAEMMRDTWGCASIAPRHALAFARAVERAHGITQKGGQHG